MKSDQQITEAIVSRMIERRKKEIHSKRAKYTMCYAVSTKTGHCYVGYNIPNLEKTKDGSGKCAENRAAYVASTYGAAMQTLVFFAIGDKGEYFNACQPCQNWVWKARGFLRFHKQKWKISVAHYIKNQWKDIPLTNNERETLYKAGNHTFDEKFAYVIDKPQW